ncbi:MAG TPA: hypothetical protein PKU97_07210 [Kofleriaceae bacterium]|nr:hypothetical protein [Kofleriaceae bacterium]
MAARKPPESWFWSHDIQTNHVDDVVLPGMHLMRLSIYGAGKMRRFAAISFREAGAESVYLVDVPAAEVTAKVSAAAAHPVSITADVEGDAVRFSLVLHKGPSSLSSLHLDLDEAAFSKLADEQHCIADFTTYVVGGARKYAAIVEERTGPSWVLANVTAQELDAKLLELGATLVRLRGFPGADGVGRFTAVAERLNVGRWAWYSDIDGDAVARHLNTNDSYPFDLEAHRDERGVRYNVVMYRDRPS